LFSASGAVSATRTSTLIQGPGGYAFGDHWRMGLPLEIGIVAVSIPAILIFWPL
jgi:di/tricarboxylate transporter